MRKSSLAAATGELDPPTECTDRRSVSPALFCPYRCTAVTSAAVKVQSKYHTLRGAFMSYPSGPQGQWPPQQPPQPYGGPQPGGQYPYGAPQQPYAGGQPYGVQQPYGGAPGPYGAPPPYGYGMTPPPGKSKSPALLIGGIGAVIIVLAGAAVFFMGGIGPFSSDQREIEKLFEDMAKTDGSVSAAKKFFCSADQKFMKDIDTSILDQYDIEVPEPSRPTAPSKISDVQVDGDKATAKVTTESKTETVHFRKEGGHWTVCMSDDPKMPTLPG